MLALIQHFHIHTILLPSSSIHSTQSLIHDIHSGVMSNISVSNLFDVKGLVVAVTGGATGMRNMSGNIVHLVRVLTTLSS